MEASKESKEKLEAKGSWLVGLVSYYLSFLCSGSRCILCFPLVPHLCSIAHKQTHTHTHLLKLFLSPSPPLSFSFAFFLAPSLSLCYSHFCTQSPPPSSLLPSFQFYPSSLPISFLLLVPFLFYALYCPALSPPCISSSTLFSIISPSSTTPFSSFSCCPPPSPPRPPFPR